MTTLKKESSPKTLTMWALKSDEEDKEDEGDKEEKKDKGDKGKFLHLPQYSPSSQSVP